MPIAEGLNLLSGFLDCRYCREKLHIGSEERRRRDRRLREKRHCCKLSFRVSGDVRLVAETGMEIKRVKV